MSTYIKSGGLLEEAIYTVRGNSHLKGLYEIPYIFDFKPRRETMRISNSSMLVRWLALKDGRSHIREVGIHYTTCIYESYITNDHYYYYLMRPYTRTTNDNLWRMIPGALNPYYQLRRDWYSNLIIDATPEEFSKSLFVEKHDDIIYVPEVKTIEGQWITQLTNWKRYRKVEEKFMTMNEMRKLQKEKNVYWIHGEWNRNGDDNEVIVAKRKITIGLKLCEIKIYKKEV